VRSSELWTFFETTARPRLTKRAEGFSMIFEHLDRFDRPVGIIETGCTRGPDTWKNDGASTVLFDKYAESSRKYCLHRGTSPPARHRSADRS
jgi:hypothetical protein